MDDTDHKSLEERARHLYRQAAEQLDPAARAGLAAARERAVGVAAPGVGRGWMLPAAAVAAAAAIGLAVVMSGRNTTDFGQLASEDSPTEDMELLLTAENFEMLSELDFYLWLDTEPDDG
jgi:hypothetical protein